MPGRCPSCNQTYTDETLSFCPNDGTSLIKDAPSSYDPQATMIAQPPPNYPPQQGYYAPQGGPTPPPQGGQTPPQGWQQPPPYGQQPPPYGQQQQQYAPQYGAAPVGSKSKLPLIIALAAVLLIGGGIAAYFLMRDNSSTSSKVSNNTNTYSTSNANRTSNATTTTSTMPTMPTTTTTTSTPPAAPTPPTTSSTTTTSTSTYTEDEKHKLFQAVGITRDNALIVEVAEKIGISDSTGNPTSGFQPFIKEHMSWAMKNAVWVRDHTDPQKARQYVMENK